MHLDQQESSEVSVLKGLNPSTHGRAQSHLAFGHFTNCRLKISDNDLSRQSSKKCDKANITSYVSSFGTRKLRTDGQTCTLTHRLMLRNTELA